MITVFSGQLRACIGLAAICILIPGVVRAQPCPSFWNAPGAPPVALQWNNLNDLQVFDDGTGPALYTAGRFGEPYSTMDPVRRWDGTQWQIVGPGQSGLAQRMCVLDDGTGARVYVIGFTSILNVGYDYWCRKWDGQQWVRQPATFYPGGNPYLSWAGVGGTRIYGISSRGSLFNTLSWWNGNTWVDISHVAGSLDGRIVPFDDGTGASLVLTGSFTSVDGVPASGIAQWKDGTWLALGDGLPGLIFARDVCQFDDGRGAALYVATDGGPESSPWAGCIAKWNGTSWESVGGGVRSTEQSFLQITKMVGLTDSNGPALYVTGIFDQAGGVPAHNMAKWDGHTWSDWGGGGPYQTYAMAAFDDGRGPSVFVSGTWQNGAFGGGVAQRVVQWVSCGRCYANCDNSSASPALNVNDFICFMNKFSRQDPYTDCNGDRVINVPDFMCFINKFAAGCP